MNNENEHPKEPFSEGESANKPFNTPETSAEDEILAALGEGIAHEDLMPPQEGEGFSNPLEALAAENHKLESEAGELKDKVLRTVAEMENLRRRTQKDIADARNYSISGFSRDIIGVVDNLRRAIDHVDAADREQPGIKSLIEGIEMTEREFLNALEKNGVRKISPAGEKFDPNFHQAMFEVPNPEVPNNTVQEVVQVGFMIGERVLRPAMVGVAKGGPKLAPTPETSEADDSEIGE